MSAVSVKDTVQVEDETSRKVMLRLLDDVEQLHDDSYNESEVPSRPRVRGVSTERRQSHAVTVDRVRHGFD